MVLAVLFCAVLAAGVDIPDFLVLSAPYSPFNADQSVNVNPIKPLAKQFAATGVNTIWAVGGMGQFDTMTVDERNALTKAWITAGHDNNLYIIAHVGSVVQADAIAMAKYAYENGADAIASVPPYYEGSGGFSTLVEWFAPICAAAPGLPFYYYHIPGSTKWAIQMYPFIQYIKSTGSLPCFKGVKYVDSNTGDFLRTVTDTSMKDMIMMWAPEPKIQSFAFPGRGTILAESFYAGTFLRMWDQFNNDNMQASRVEQLWKMQAETIFGSAASLGGTSTDVAKRAIYTALCGQQCDIGLPRDPQSRVPLPPAVYSQLVQDLTSKIGFFNQTYPRWTPPRT